MSTRFLLVRHGQTDWNRDQRFRGHTDLPLNAVGKREAEAVAERIETGYHPAAVYCGPLLRTRQTAAAIAGLLGQDVTVDLDLIDLDCGDFAGLSQAEAEARYPRLYHTWLTAPDAMRFPGGESLGDVRKRAGYLVAALARQYPDEQVVLVSHLDVIRVLLCDWLGLPLGHISAFQIHTASLTVVDVGPGEFALGTLNETCHLREITLPSDAVGTVLPDTTSVSGGTLPK